MKIAQDLYIFILKNLTYFHLSDYGNDFLRRMKMEGLFNVVGINLSQLTKNEKFLFESYILVCLHRELFKKFKLDHGKSLDFIKYDATTEDMMLETNFLLYIIKDILATEEYSLIGIANYTRMPEEVIYDLVSGMNKAPSSLLWQKIINLHSLVRRDLYCELIKKIILNPKHA